MSLGRAGASGCPPLETVVVLWGEGADATRFQVFKLVVGVVDDDLPVSFEPVLTLGATRSAFHACIVDA